MWSAFLALCFQENLSDVASGVRARNQSLPKLDYAILRLSQSTMVAFGEAIFLRSSGNGLRSEPNADKWLNTTNLSVQ